MEGARQATSADVERLAQLTAEAVDEQLHGRGGSIWARREARSRPAQRSLGEAVADPDQLVLAGTIDDTVIGYAAAHVEPLEDGALLGVLSDIYVEPGARAVGVGEALVEQVVTWCGRRGCVGVDALALPGNRHTKNFFETFGFKARALVVHRSLEAGEPPDDGPAEPEVVEVEVADA